MEGDGLYSREWAQVRSADHYDEQYEWMDEGTISVARIALVEIDDLFVPRTQRREGIHSRIFTRSLPLDTQRLHWLMSSFLWVLESTVSHR